jgi:hypothetical protein
MAFRSGRVKESAGLDHYPANRSPAKLIGASEKVEEKLMTKKATSFTVLAFGLWTGMGLHAQSVNLATGALTSQVLTIPHKASISGSAVVSPSGDHSNGVVDLILRLYATQTSSTPLFVERQAVPVQNGSYLAFIGSATPGGIPASVYDAYGTFWIEANPASSLSSDTSARTPFTLRRDASTPGTDAITLTFAVDSSVCYTCGGAWPVFSGMIPSAGGHATERPAGCGGNFTYANDGSPYICSR